MNKIPSLASLVSSAVVAAPLALSSTFIATSAHACGAGGSLNQELPVVDADQFSKNGVINAQIERVEPPFKTRCPKFSSNYGFTVNGYSTLQEFGQAVSNFNYVTLKQKTDSDLKNCVFIGNKPTDPDFAPVGTSTTFQTTQELDYNMGDKILKAGCVVLQIKQ